jgi:hypothetical protein
MWREELAFSKWLGVNKNLACKAVLNCTNVQEIKRVFTLQISCKGKIKPRRCNHYGRLPGIRIKK